MPGKPARRKVPDHRPAYDSSAQSPEGHQNPTVDIRDVQVIKHNRSFFLSDDRGDVPKDNTGALGLYHRDTRFLSRLELTLDGGRPLLLHSSPERNYSQVVELAYATRMVDPQGHEHRENLSLARNRVLGDSLFERNTLSNYSPEAKKLRLRIAFEADFLDIFEVRGLARERRGKLHEPKVGRSEVTLSYRGLDDVTRRTTIKFSPQPAELSGDEAMFELSLGPGEHKEITVEVTPEAEGERIERRSIRQTRETLEEEYSTWRKQCTRLKTSNVQLAMFLDRAVLDLRMLMAEDDSGENYLDAGVPWFAALFGRDAVITAYQCLGVNRELAWGTLRLLAEHQGKRKDPEREEEPGKILHELRVGEMAGAGEIPHTPYYGSIDVTPLWVVLLGYAHAWSGDLDAVRELWPAAQACLQWIDEYGDRDGDGYVEYEKMTPRGLDNQGWKDSFDGIVYPDGTEAKPPIALVEVQGYVYDAKRRAAELARMLEDDELAERLDREADELKKRFNEDFWMPKEGFFALALDGDKKQVATITSNPGHCLWSGIIDEDKAPHVARKLLSSQMSGGWGIRTLGSGQRPYDPIGYHTGAVWPHDNAIIAHGLKHYSLDQEAMKVIDQLSMAGMHFPLARYPELFCGFSSDDVPVPVQYPVACRPQAWASGSPLLMLRSYGGISADAPNGRLYIVRPELPDWLDEMEIAGLGVGEARVDLTFTKQNGVTAVQVPRKEGEIEILIRQ